MKKGFLFAFIFTLALAIIGIVIFACKYYGVKPKNITDEEPQAITSEDDPVIIDDIKVPACARSTEGMNDAIGWIEIPGLEISDAVVQTTNDSYYLSHDEFGSHSVWGAYYLFSENGNTVDTLDRVSIIFGHSNGDLTYPKFAALKLLRHPSRAQNSQYIKLWFGEEQTLWQIFAVGDYPISDSYMEANPDDIRFEELVNNIKEISINEYTSATVTNDDKILILSTCSGHDVEDYRYIVCAKLIEK